VSFLRSKFTSESQVNPKTSSSEERGTEAPAAECNWSGFNFSKKAKILNLKIKKSRVKHFQQSYQLDISDCEAPVEDFFNWKHQLCEDLQNHSIYHHAWKIDHDKIVTWRPAQLDAPSPGGLGSSYSNGHNMTNGNEGNTNFANLMQLAVTRQDISPPVNRNS
jgi:hypothetical protein